MNDDPSRTLTLPAARDNCPRMSDSPTHEKPEMIEAANPPPAGPAVIAGYLKMLTSQPGVYRMLDAEGTVLYVGKARNLKARVSNYARGNGHSNRIARMISLTTAMEFVTVRTEAEALLLEANLIKRFKPRFNVLMRDDKSFPYILIRRDTLAPQIVKHRGARAIKGDYFGPFASAGAVSRVISMLQRAFLLRSCSDSVFEGRTRPCLLFQIKRCAGPCTNEIPAAEYHALVEEAVRFLRGESQSCAPCTRSSCRKPPTRSNSNARPSSAIVFGPSPTYKPIKPSIPTTSRKPTSSPPTRKAGKPAFRSSSSAPVRTGAIALITPRPTNPCLSKRCSHRSSPNSMTTSPFRACFLSVTTSKNAR